MSRARAHRSGASDPTLERPPIVVVTGATAAGKTRAAVALAQALGGELVGADSVQVYRGFDIGSAKPTAEELGGVRHHLLDVVDPTAEIDAAAWSAMADEAIREIAARGGLPLVVGGTGLWLRALLRGLVDAPPPDPALRARLEAQAREEGPAAMHARLARVDPRSADAIHPHDRVRIVRALELHEQTGRPAGELRAAHALGAPRYRAFVAVLDLPRAELASKVAARTANMLSRGLVAEVRALLHRWGPQVRAFRSVGYRQMLQHVQGEIDLEEATRRMNKATRTYARRQRNWFRGEPGSSAPASAESLIAGPERARLEAFLAADLGDRG